MKRIIQGMDIYGVWVSVPVYKGPEGPREEEQVRVYGMYEMCGVSVC